MRRRIADLPDADASLLECPRLVVEGLSVTYRATGTVVSDVSFDVSPGQIVGVVGHSSSGKSTLLNALVGVLPDEADVAGRVMVEGRDLAELAPAERRRLRGQSMGIIPQHALNAWNPVRTIGDHIDETLATHRRQWTRASCRDHVASWCDRLGIPRTVLARFALQLSGGLRQRAALLLALCQQPSVLFADEPTSALDTVTQAEVLTLLREITSDQRLATVIVTHDIAAIASVADELIVIERGRIVEQGPTTQVLVAAGHDHTRALITATFGQRRWEPPGDRSSSE